MLMLHITPQTLSKISSWLTSASTTRFQLFRSSDGFAATKGVLDDLFRDPDKIRAGDSELGEPPTFQHGLWKSKLGPRKGDEQEGPTDGKGRSPKMDAIAEIDHLRVDKLSVFRLALDVTVEALRDERNRRWFDVSRVA